MCDHFVKNSDSDKCTSDCNNYDVTKVVQLLVKAYDYIDIHRTRRTCWTVKTKNTKRTDKQTE